jgi:hypothetical protein
LPGAKQRVERAHATSRGDPSRRLTRSQHLAAGLVERFRRQRREPHHLREEPDRFTPLRGGNLEAQPRESRASC